MDLGIAGRTALVCASSRGLGSACAWELARAGCNLIVNGRERESLEANAAAIRRDTGVTVKAVVADVNTEAGRERLFDAAPEPDILINNNGGQPHQAFAELGLEAIQEGLTASMIAPLRLTQRVVDGMVQRRFGRIVCITSVAVKQPMPGYEMSSAARLGLTGALAGVARSVAHANVTINFLLPGGFGTERAWGVLKGVGEREGISPEDAMTRAMADQPTRRIGRPEEFGAACGFLCSAQAGFIVGQSLLIDGGAFPGVF